MNLQKLGKWSFIIIGGLLAIAAGLLALSNLMAGRDAFNLLGVNSDIFRLGMMLIPLCLLAWFLFKYLDADGKKKKKSVSQYYSNRWMTNEERDKVYIYTKASQLASLKKTGPLARFELIGNDIHINMVSKDFHSIILGTTGAAKTQGYVFPFLYTLGFSNQKPNLVVTDPKGEIYNTLAESLRHQGYDVQVFNLNDPIRSSRWNPFERPWDMFQRAQHLEQEIKRFENADPAKMGLRIIASSYPPVWYAFNGIAFPSKEMAENEMRTLRQQLISDSEADIKDICSAICPIENEKDPSWEQGARDLIQGTAMAMLEDSLNPNLGMTREKFNFYNIFKILSIRDNDPQAVFKTIKNYFEGRDKLSVAAALAQTVTSNAENTMRNFFGVVTQKLSMFNDKGICYITSGTDIKFNEFAKKPTAFFLIIPDQIKVRHPLATLCISQLYKSLVASANERGGKLPWPTYFVLDEFGNMPKINDFATVITVSRSRGIFFTLVLQDYKQLETTYGLESAVTVRNNCNHQVFVGVNDTDTRKMFSDLMGDMEITTESTTVSLNTGKAAKDDPKGGSKSTATNSASRPLLPPNELLDIVPGNIFVYCFTFHPLRSKVTLFYECLNKGVIRLKPTPDIYVPGKYFDEAAIYYDIRRRNDIVIRRVNNAQRHDLFEW